jgi:hypothetical protein
VRLQSDRAKHLSQCLAGVGIVVDHENGAHAWKLGTWARARTPRGRFAW